MELSFSKLLNIERNERSVVYLLLAQSVFLGIFAGSLDVGANAMFLDVYSADLMPQAFMISGAVGIFFTSIYTFFQKRLPFKTFTILNLFFVILVAALLRLGYSITSDPRLTFAYLVFMGPVIIISMLGFWGTAGRYFSLREGKRLFGIIDTGSIIGMIIAFYAVPILVNIKFEVHNTLLLGLGSLVLALVFQIILMQRHRIRTAVEVPVSRKRSSGFFTIFRNRYTSLMAFFIMLSVVSGFFIHYAFMWATEVNYTNSVGLTSFLGTFFGTMMIFTVVIKSTLYGWMMKNYGLRVSLLISPALLLILTVIASLVGSIFGYGAAAAGFTFFFLVIALSKLFNKSLKDAIESPSMKTLYQSLDQEERFDVQARIDGVVNEFTAFLSGLIMAGLLLVSFVSVIHFSYLLIILLRGWFLLGIMLYRSYRKKLQESLASARIRESETQEAAIGETALVRDAPMFSDLTGLFPGIYYSLGRDQLEDLLLSDDRRRRYYAWQLVSDKLFITDQELIRKAKENAGDQGVLELVRQFERRMNFSGDLQAALKSGIKETVLAALMQIVKENDRSQVPQLIALLRDRDTTIRGAAIEAAGKLKVKELGSYLVDYIGHPELYAVSWHALVHMGEIILENLENAFHKTGVDQLVQVRLVRAMQSIGGEKANNYLFQKINYHQREVREAAIKGLDQNNFVPSQREIPSLLDVVYDITRAGAGYIAAEYVVRNNDPGNGLLEAIIEEKKNADQLLFTLLGIIYDKPSVEHVRESLQDEENEDTGFALELLNMIVADEVYAYLEPYFDVLSIPERIRRLQNEMPVEILPFGELLVELLNKDRLFAGSYLRICAIEALRNNTEIEAGKYLASQVFHPDPMIRQSALSVLAGTDASLAEELNARFAESDAAKLMNMGDESRIHTSSVGDLVAELKLWPIMKDLELELIYKLACHFLLPSEVTPGNEEAVSLIHAASYNDESLQKGIILNLSDYSSVLKLVEDLVSRGIGEIYQVKRKVFREFVFDHPDLAQACMDLFTGNQIELLLHPQITET